MYRYGIGASIVLCGVWLVVAAEASQTPRAVVIDADQLRVRSVPSVKGVKIGILRRGAVVKVQRKAAGQGCDSDWYHIEGDGYICSDYVTKTNSSPRQSPAEPQAEAPLAPYGRVQKGSARLCKTPGALWGQGPWDCRSVPEGALLRLNTLVFPGGWAWRTVSGEYIRSNVVEPLGPLLPSPGKRLSSPPEGVTAIVRRETEVRVRAHKKAAITGRLQPYQHVALKKGTKSRDDDYVQLSGGGFVASNDVRILRFKTTPPRGLPASKRWIGVDLREQTLVAYELDQPVYASLASAGRWRGWTPAGTYRIQKKTLAAEMSNADRTNTYLIQDVPWVMFFQDNYAIHGAFWHDEFGSRRSHGCVNLALDDARWVFEWADPPLPTGWHAVLSTRQRLGSPIVVFE